ncbi:UNVERIFIED_CONTAM: hypothetical protein FKN15_046134 [Acipenser sinensis]
MTLKAKVADELFEDLFDADASHCSYAVAVASSPIEQGSPTFTSPPAKKMRSETADPGLALLEMALVEHCFCFVREALNRILWNLCGYLTPQQVNHVLTSDFSIEKYLPLSCLQASGNITAVQLKKSLDSMGLVINDDEFDRLWLRKVDISDEGSVSLEKFKEILEKTFQIQLTEEQLQGAVSIIGDKETNLLSYTKFFALFHNRPTTCELKEEVERCSPFIHVNFRPDKLRYRESFKGDWSRYSHAQKIRPLQEVPLRVVYALFLTLKCNVLPAEMDDLCLAFDRDKDGHFHYIQFLKFYVKSNKGT